MRTEHGRNFELTEPKFHNQIQVAAVKLSGIPCQEMPFDEWWERKHSGNEFLPEVVAIYWKKLYEKEWTWSFAKTWTIWDACTKINYITRIGLGADGYSMTVLKRDVYTNNNFPL